MKPRTQFLRRALARAASLTLALLLVAAALAEDRGAPKQRSSGGTVREVTRDIGHATRDAAKAVGRATRDITRSIGHAFRGLGKKLGD